MRCPLKLDFIIWLMYKIHTIVIKMAIIIIFFFYGRLSVVTSNRILYVLLQVFGINVRHSGHVILRGSESARRPDSTYSTGLAIDDGHVVAAQMAHTKSVSRVLI